MRRLIARITGGPAQAEARSSRTRLVGCDRRAVAPKQRRMHVAGLLHLGAGKTSKMIPKGVCRAARADFAIFFVPKMPCSANLASCLRLARQSTPGVF